MSRIARAGALLGTSAVLAAAFSGVAHAAPKQQAKGAPCMVWVYTAKHYRGSAACIGHSGNFTGSLNNSISSISIEKACKVTLYRDPNYKGAHSTWNKLKSRPSNSWRNDADLSNNKVGDNKASSVNWDCSFAT